jgi:hypothetical protein
MKGRNIVLNANTLIEKNIREKLKNSNMATQPDPAVNEKVR